MEKLIQQVWSRFLRVLEVVDEAVSSGSYQDLENGLSHELDALGQFILKETLESIDERLRENLQERRGWVVERRGDVKEVLSPFGPVRYHRTYFRNKVTGKYGYLTDEWIGLTPHARVAPSVKATLAESAARMSYRRSGKWAWNETWNVSGQTVMNTLRKNQSLEASQSRPKKQRQVEYLYVEADEDHIPNQDSEGAHWQPRLVYVHEGLERTGKRRELKNVHYFGGLYYRDTEALCQEVWRYLDKHYDLESVKTIFVSGDGASWIRQLVEFIPGSVFVLDRFHTAKYIRAALGRWDDLHESLWRAVKQTDRQEVRNVLREAHKRADTKNKRETIEKTLTYLMQQWDGIQAWSKYADAIVGCSAEGHVSHVYAARMSSRPMAWTKTGVDQMARLRVLQANGESVRERFLRGFQERKLRLSDRWREQVQTSIKQGKQLYHAIQASMPALRGRRTTLTRALRGLANAV